MCCMKDPLLTDYRFPKTFDEAIHKRIETRAPSFHCEILTNVLEGYVIPTSVFANLEKVIKQIAEGIKLSGESSREQQQYWVMFTRSEYEEITQTVQAGKLPSEKNVLPVIVANIRSNPGYFLQSHSRRQTLCVTQEVL